MNPSAYAHVQLGPLSVLKMVRGSFLEGSNESEIPHTYLFVYLMQF